MLKRRRLVVVLGSVLGAVLLAPSERLGQASPALASSIDGTLPLNAIGPEPAQMSVDPGPEPVASFAILASGLKGTATPSIDIPDSPKCPDGMVQVEGDYCPNVEQKCLRWLDPTTQMRCAEFEPETKCIGRTVHKKFCIDRFEYPNKAGEKPVVMKTWYEAQHACTAQGKRLCGDSEWTLACEGEERLPYPYGYARNADACNIDKPHPAVNEQALANPATRAAEAARLDQRDPSASREACVSPYGVHDMTGNVDEWVVNESGAPYKSGLKGGYWGPVRTRCRPMTTAHYEMFSFYQIGFRCCGEPGLHAPATPAGGLGTGGSGPSSGGAGPAGDNSPAVNTPAPSTVIAGS